MHFSELFIRRPVMTTLLMGSILVFGFMAYRFLPVSDLPNVDFPTIQVSANLPGASPETMGSSVATSLERQFSTIAGLDSMTSVSSNSSTQITLQFSLNRSIDDAAQDVQAAIAKSLSKLPPDMPSPPSYSKVNPADSPIIYIALTSPTLPLSRLNEYGETMLSQRISMISGVAQVMVYGSQKYAVRISLDPLALARRQIGIDEVIRGISSANVNLPTGALQGTQRSYTVEANGQLEDAAAFRPVIIKWMDGSPVRLGELAIVSDSVENNRIAASYNTPEESQRAVVLAVQRQPGTNTVAVADAIRSLIPTFQAQLPASVSLNILFDRSQSIRESVHDVKFTLLLTLFLVVLVIFLFLRTFTATFIPSVAMPMSIVGTFGIMYLLGYSLDNLSLMALTLSVGFVVDDAIVMLENIVRHIEQGESVFEAALSGSREIGFTIVSMTLSLAAVFIPVLFMGGIVGRLFHEFAVTIGAAVIVSGFVSLTLTPMLCSRFLKPTEARQNGFNKASEAVFAGILGVYEKALRWSVGHRFVMILILVSMLGGSVYLFRIVPKGFLPSEDNGQLFAMLEAAEGTSWENMQAYQQEVVSIIRKDPAVSAFMSSVGSSGGSGGVVNTGRAFIRLKARNERDATADEVVDRLRPQLGRIPGVRVFLQNPPTLRIGGRFSKSLYQYTIQGTDIDEIYRITPILESRMKEIPGLLDVTTDLQLKNPQLEVNIDRDRAASLGITAESIESALFSAYGTRQVSRIYAPDNEYAVIMELQQEYQNDPSALSLLSIRSSNGELVPLETLVSLRRTVGPLSVNHSGQLPSATISFNLEPGLSLGDAVTRIDALARQILPDTLTTSFQGTAQAFQSSLQNLGLLLLMAVLVIYIVLGILYESFLHPITILSSLPLAGFGALLTLLIFKVDLSIYAFVGIIMLVGLVKKNGIMMVDFALEAERTMGLSPQEAITQACLIRFRPIMMTTMAALMGAIPIATGFGAGGEARQPLGLVVVGGLLFSQLLTLFITPALYLVIDRLRGKRANDSPLPQR